MHSETSASYHYSLLLRNAYRILRIQATEALEEFRLNTTQWAVLGVVHDAKEGITITDTASRVGVKVPLITIVADSLVKKGVINRIPNKSDSRSKLLHLTDKGEDLMSTVERKLEESFTPTLSGVSSEELATFAKVLSAINSSENKNQ